METDARMLEDIHHQLRTPINSAYVRIIRIHRVLRDEHLPREAMRELWALRGLLGRAQHVVRSAGMFSKLAHGEPVQTTQMPLRAEWFLKELVAVLVDTEVMENPARGMDYRFLNRDIFRDNDVVAHGDPDLIDLALRNLLDNARKYSYPNTAIIVEPKLWKKTCVISVRNIGLRLGHNDVAKCIRRGWRGDRAMAVTGEGSGIGLWITDEIMRAQGGELRVVPTNDKGETEFQLLLPKEGLSASTLS